MSENLTIGPNQPTVQILLCRFRFGNPKLYPNRHCPLNNFCQVQLLLNSCDYPETPRVWSDRYDSDWVELGSILENSALSNSVA